jgi:hypothetical protein
MITFQDLCYHSVQNPVAHLRTKDLNTEATKLLIIPVVLFGVKVDLSHYRKETIFENRVLV